MTNSAGYGILFKFRPVVVFGLCVMLVHLPNGSTAAARGTEARRRIYGRGDGHDVGLHRCTPKDSESFELRLSEPTTG
jgi:hypothetical protein